MSADEQIANVTTALENVNQKIEKRAQQSIEKIEKQIGERAEGAFAVVDQFTESVGQKLLDFENQFRQVSNFPPAGPSQQAAGDEDKTG